MIVTLTAILCMWQPQRGGKPEIAQRDYDRKAVAFLSPTATDRTPSKSPVTA